MIVDYRKLDDLHIYYFSWFYANKGVIVGRRISQFLEAEMIPPAFVAVIERAKALSLGINIYQVKTYIGYKHIIVYIIVYIIHRTTNYFF